VPKDNAVTTNFKQVKSRPGQEVRRGAAVFDAGALRAEMHAHAATLPAGLEAGRGSRSRPATAGGGAPAHGPSLARSHAIWRSRPDRRLARRAPPPRTPRRHRRKFLEAIWRYYNIVDFAVAMA